MRCAICYHLNNSKNVKNTHEGVLFLIKLKVTTLHECFSHFLNCTNCTKSRKASRICAVLSLRGRFLFEDCKFDQYAKIDFKKKARQFYEDRALARALSK